MKRRGVGSILFLALLCAGSCTRADEEAVVPSAGPEEQITILTPTRSYEEALAIAGRSIALVDRGLTRAACSRSIRSERGQCVTIPATRSGGTGTDTLMYVFNFEDDAGFALIAANRAVDPVLGVAEKGNYTYGEKTGVENFDFYMEALTQTLAVIDRPVVPPIDTLRTTPRFKTVQVDEHRSCEPLVPVQWGQDGTFGAYASNGIAGCVATAMAQIMAYYRYPIRFTATYTDAPHAGETIYLDWPSIIAYPYVYQVSALLREIGQRVGMDYKTGLSVNSEAFSKDVPKCMRSFGYNCPSGLVAFASAPIRAALDEGRPVYIDGRDAANPRSGHAWVADGYEYSRVGTEYYEEKLFFDGVGRGFYDYVLVSSTVETTDLLHYNWGWNGYCDGKFVAINNCALNDYDNTVFVNMQMITSISLKLATLQ